MNKEAKLRNVEEKLNYWKQELKRADNDKRRWHCRAMVQRWQTKANNPELTAGY